MTFLRFLTRSFLVLASLSTIAAAQPSEQALGQARARYEAGMEAWRSRVRCEIRSPRCKQSAEEKVALLRAFRMNGDVPALPELARCRTDLLSLRTKLLNAFDERITDLLATDEEGAAAVVAEKAVWQQIRDTAEWIVLSTESIPSVQEPGAGAANEVLELVLPIEPGAGYRLEVSGRVLGGDPVQLRLAQTEALVDVQCTNARFRTLVTVSPDGAVVIDAGGKLAASNRTGEPLAGLALLCRPGTVQIEQVRWKPFVVAGENEFGDAQDDQLAFWPVGTRIDGMRDAGRQVTLAGVVTRSDTQGLEIRLVERWTKDGKERTPIVTWVYERVGIDRETGRVRLKNVAQRHDNAGVKKSHQSKRSAVAGDVVLKGPRLQGDYQFHWRVGAGKLHKATRRRPVEMRAASGNTTRW